MKIKKDTQSILHIENFNLYIGIICWTCALLILGRIGYLISKSVFELNDTFWLASFLLFFFGGSAFAMKEKFIVDKNEGLIRWSRKGLLKSERGEIPFNEIDNVIVEKTYGDAGFGYRVSIKTKKATIPVSTAYSAGAENECVQIKGKIAQLI